MHAIHKPKNVGGKKAGIFIISLSSVYSFVLLWLVAKLKIMLAISENLPAN